MIPRNLFALLVGINEYPRESRVSRLRGCVHDINRVHNILQQYVPAATKYSPRLLVDQEATREAIIKGFREHLSAATQDDSVLFMYCGHGSRQPSAPEFRRFYPEGMDETLVCYNSRLAGQYDLADKEIAALLHQYISQGVHCLVIFDCCHSGSGTRTQNGSGMPIAREAPEQINARPLETYLEGFYADRLAKGGKLNLPSAKHMLMAACSRHQLAYEHPAGHGNFSHALAKVLEDTQLAVSYQKILSRCRYETMKMSLNQTPDLEDGKGHLPRNPFLMLKPLKIPDLEPRIPVSIESGHFFLEAGVIHGLKVQGLSSYRLLVYRAGDSKSIAEVSLDSIGFERSLIGDHENLLKKLPCTLEADFDTLYKPLAVFRDESPDPLSRIFLKALAPGIHPQKKEFAPDPPFGIRRRNSSIDLFHFPSQRIINSVAADEHEFHVQLAANLFQVMLWQRLASIGVTPNFLRGPRVEIQFGYQQGSKWKVSSSSQPLEIEVGPSQLPVFPAVKIKNSSTRRWYLILFYLSPSFGITLLRKGEAPPKSEWMDFWGGTGEDDLYLPPESAFATVHFSIIVSEAPILHTGIVFPDINPSTRSKQREPTQPPLGQWDVIGLTMLLMREAGTIGTHLQRIGNGTLVILPHQHIRATLKLSSATDPVMQGHPASIGADILARLPGNAKLISLTDSSTWLGEALCIQPLERRQGTGGPLHCRIRLPDEGIQCQVWCLGTLEGHVFSSNPQLLALTQVEQNMKKWHDIFLPSDAFLAERIWLWFFLLDHKAKAKDCIFLARDYLDDL